MEQILITGGAGFIGMNTAIHYLQQGIRVRILDNFSRDGVEKNAAFLKKNYPAVEIITGDVRDPAMCATVVEGADVVFHFAGQVAVTGSVLNPFEDFTVNAQGTIQILEAVRKQKNPPVVLYSSTNKVYGSLEHLRITEDATRYSCPDRPEGIDETERLDFHSPYGCSKGAADQYVHDYARIYDIPTIVFRQSCIYGPHQFGVEDQGWVAWFLIAALQKKPLTIYGTGKQVRDLLWIDDLVSAFTMAITNIKTTKGNVYNIGGGSKNSISVWKEFGPLVEKEIGKSISVAYDTERPGDQPYFVANTKKALTDFGWNPLVANTDGISRLAMWLKTESGIV
jgi:CDP-paratose 2-epimerase